MNYNASGSEIINSILHAREIITIVFLRGICENSESAFGALCTDYRLRTADCYCSFGRSGSVSSSVQWTNYRSDRWFIYFIFSSTGHCNECLGDNEKWGIFILFLSNMFAFPISTKIQCERIPLRCESVPNPALCRVGLLKFEGSVPSSFRFSRIEGTPVIR